MVIVNLLEVCIVCCIARRGCGGAMVYLFPEVHHADHSNSYIEKSVFGPFLPLTMVRGGKIRTSSIGAVAAPPHL